MGIQFDIYGGTHQPGFAELHDRLSQHFFKTMHDKGYFAKKTTEQLYDVQAEQFLPDRYVKGTCYHRLPMARCGITEAYGDQCETCGNLIDPLQLINPVSTITGTGPSPRDDALVSCRPRFEQPLREWLESKRQPRERLPAVARGGAQLRLGQIQQGLPERAMTRDLRLGRARAAG